jgi:hypothetical protein
MLLICDPPAAVCHECVNRDPAGFQATMRAMGHLWNHQCDRCVYYSKLMSAVTVAGLGHLTISGHVCVRCGDKDEQHAFETAEQVVLIDRAARRRAQRAQKKRKA